MKHLAQYLLTATIILQTTALAGNSCEAKNLIQKTVDSVLSVLRDKEIEQDSKKNRIMDIINPVFDFNSMAMLTLGRRHWPNLNKQQRKEFTDLFIKQLQDAYFDKAELFSEEEVTFDPPEEAGNKVHVNTKIISKEDRIAMKYKLYKASSGWRVYDIEIEGVSIVSSYRSQYNQILSNGSVDDLLQKMRDKTLPPDSKG